MYLQNIHSQPRISHTAGGGEATYPKTRPPPSKQPPRLFSALRKLHVAKYGCDAHMFARVFPPLHTHAATPANLHD